MFNIKEELEKHGKLVMKKKTSNPDLFVLKYHNSVFWNAAWTPFLHECRGLVVDSNDNLVSYPFSKIFNFRKESGAPELEDSRDVAVVRKVNGFMVAMTAFKGELLLSTTGSIDSDFANLARSHVTPELEKFIVEVVGDEHTVMFECCDPSDPHIIDEEPGLYFLGMRMKYFGSHIQYNPNHEVWNSMGVKTVPVEYKTVGEVKEELKTCRHEGFVMYDEELCGCGETDEQVATKWKSPYYLTKKLFMRGNIEKLLAKDIKQTIDEEYYELIAAIEKNRESFSAMEEADRKVWIEQFLGEVK